MGGRFSLEARSTNGPLNIEFNKDAPVDSTLRLCASTTNSPVRAVLPPAFEGAFFLHSSLWPRPVVHADEHVEDPAGEGRQRIIETQYVGRGDAKGQVSWGPGTHPRGSVNLATTNLSIMLEL